MYAADPVATVRRYVDAFNDGDEEKMSANFAAEGTILDGMAPHLWQGPAAARDWYRDVLLHAKEEGASDYAVSLGEPLQTMVTGNDAYLVVPAKMMFTIRGKPFTQTGAFFTVALRKFGGTWRITAWAWTKGTLA